MTRDHVTVCRLIVLRHPGRPDRQVTLQWEGLVVVVPIQMRGGFGQLHYTWDGRETTVQGFPVYRA